jgi:hypothetical protein
MWDYDVFLTKPLEGFWGRLMRSSIEIFLSHIYAVIYNAALILALALFVPISNTPKYFSDIKRLNLKTALFLAATVTAFLGVLFIGITLFFVLGALVLAFLSGFATIKNVIKFRLEILLFVLILVFADVKTFAILFLVLSALLVLENLKFANMKNLNAAVLKLSGEENQ